MATAGPLYYVPNNATLAYSRRVTRVVSVGNVAIGGDNPIRVQSMTTTDTTDIEASVAQIRKLVEAGAEIVRLTTPTLEAAKALAEISRKLKAEGVSVPLVADVHFNAQIALEAANWADKVRINPGNFADRTAHTARGAAQNQPAEYSDEEYAAELARIEEEFLPLVNLLKEKKAALRIGVNHGSLSARIMSRYGDTPQGMVESALEYVRIASKHGYHSIVLSMKASNTRVMVAAYRLLCAQMNQEGFDYPIHLGVTEAGLGIDARVKSAVGIGSLLDDGIGDTIRVSLAEDPENEIPVARRLADLYSGPRTAERVASIQIAPAHYPAEERNPFKYSRRKSKVVAIGTIRAGWLDSVFPPEDPNVQRQPWSEPIYPTWVPSEGDVLPKVVVDVTDALDNPDLLDPLFFTDSSEGSAPVRRPDAVQIRFDGLTRRDAEANLAKLKELLSRRELLVPIITSYPLEANKNLGPAGLRGGDCLKVVVTPGLGENMPNHRAVAAIRRACSMASAGGVSLWIEATDPTRLKDDTAGMPSIERSVDFAMALAYEAETHGMKDVILGVRAADYSRSIRASRLLAARIDQFGLYYPTAINVLTNRETLVPASAGEISPSLPLSAALAIGGPLVDGIGDIVQITSGSYAVSPSQASALAFESLQATGARLTKAEVIACPSCGRTLFDIQGTTERIKARVGHLAGVKIAVMGCVVNGPGELADADFGYMGGAPGLINLYFGQECVERDVPEAEAEDKLVELIKSRGRWIEKG